MSDEPIEGQPAEQAPAPEGTPEGGDKFQMPEKFEGKTAEEIAKSHVELERKLSELTAKGAPSAEIAEIKSTLTELREAILAKKEPEAGSDEEVKQKQKEYLKSLGIPTMDDLKQAEERGRKGYELDRINADLAKKYDGKDGRPVFNSKEVGEYAIQNGMDRLNPETVYELKYKAELRDWDIKQALKGNRAPNVPGVGKGAQQPAEPDFSKMKPGEVEATARQKALDRINAQEQAL